MFVFILGNKMASSYNSYMRTKGASANHKELKKKKKQLRSTSLIFKSSVVRLYMYLGRH